MSAQTHQPVDTIVIPTKLQTDTVIAIFLLRRFGSDRFPDIERATISIESNVSDDHAHGDVVVDGRLHLDSGGGALDHHKSPVQTTATHLVARYLDVADHEPLEKLLELARRDDMEGKGIISDDPLDRAFGLPGLIATMAKIYTDNPGFIAESVIPLLEAHYTEEYRRKITMPREFQELVEHGAAQFMGVKHRKKKLHCILIRSDNTSMAGYLRSQEGGRYDVVVQRLSSGHVNILTRPAKRFDLRSLVAVVRQIEADRHDSPLPDDMTHVVAEGNIPEVLQWYYHKGTNTLLNGGMHPKDVEPSALDDDELWQAIKVGLSEQFWSPLT